MTNISYSKKRFLGILCVVVVLAAAVLVVKKKFFGKLPNIVLIVMDTTRRDHLSCYGYERNTTPNLSKLAKSSRVYYKAYSNSGWTAPAHTSLFTGLFPIAHKVTQENPVTSSDLTTLAEILSDVGYKTVGLVGNCYVGRALQY